MPWQLPLDRMQVLAALEQLASEDWGDGAAAQTIVVAFFSLPEFEPPKREVHTSMRAPKDSVEGLTEFGTVQVESGGEEWRTSMKGVAPEDRRSHIGRFVITRSVRYPVGVILFRDFRAEDPLKVDKPPLSRYRLWYNLEWLVPLRLDRLDAVRRPPSFYERLHFLCTRIRYGKSLLGSSWSWETTVIHQIEQRA